MKPVTPAPIEKEKINKDFKFPLGILKLKKGNKHITTTNILSDPKSKGGTNESHNVTLTCQPCNSKKADIYPYENYKGEELPPSNPYPFFDPMQKNRPEWEPFLFKK